MGFVSNSKPTPVMKESKNMLKYIVKRVLSLILVIIGVTFLVFMIMSLAPGDPARFILGDHATPEALEEKREELGLNDPVFVRYGRYMFGVIQGDFGVSFRTGRPVAQDIFDRFPNTLRLTLAALLVCVALALPLGIIAAIRQNTFIDSICMFIALIGVSMPVFWLGLLLILLFSLHLQLLPSFGADGFASIILPACTLGFVYMAGIARTIRSSMLEVIRQDYIRTAMAKGISYGTVIQRHAVRNAMIPTLTVTGLILGIMLGGSVITETVFSWPGIGRWLVQAIFSRDTPTVLGCLILFSVCFSVVNLIVDLLYGLVDPRIRSQYK